MASDGEIRERILDAAQECVLEAGLSARLHAAIAERAGMSRPTVYKYAGDQDAIIEALLHREVERFLAATEPVLTKRGDLRERFIETVVFVVDYARGHKLLQKGLRDQPEAVVPWFTTNAGPLIEQAMEFFAPHLRAAMDEGQIADTDPRVIVEWAYRLIVSLITTRGGLPVEETGSLRSYVGALFQIGASVE